MIFFSNHNFIVIVLQTRHKVMSKWFPLFVTTRCKIDEQQKLKRNKKLSFNTCMVTYKCILCFNLLSIEIKISRIPLIGLETRLGWRIDRKVLRNPNLNEISLPDVMFVTRGSKNSLFFVFDFLSNLDCGFFCWMVGHFLLRIATRTRESRR